MNQKITKTLLIVALLLPFGTLLAQTRHACGTEDIHQLSTYQHVKNKLNWNTGNRNNDPYSVPVKFHIIGASNGAFAIDSVLIFDELNRVNERFQDANIQFEHCGELNYIYSNDYILFIKNDDEDLCDLHDIEEAINIYFAPNVEREDGEGICGYAYNYDIKKRIIMDNGCATNGSTLAHELGHSFSLLHTHSTREGVELVDGSNCASAGDLICDTPADPKLSSDKVDQNCAYIGGETDPANTAYIPDTRNIMSYSRKSCRNHFSQEQLVQMESFHAENEYLLACQLNSSTNNETGHVKEIHVYPNPSSSIIHCENLPPGSIVDIYTPKGEQVSRNSYDIAYELSLVSISQLPAGIYYLRIESQDQVVFYKLLKV